MAAEAITVRASGDQPERRFAPDSGHLAITVKPFQRSFETDAIYPVEGHPYTENRVIYGVGRLTFSDKFGWVNKADAGVFEGREFRVSIVDRGDDSSAYASDDLAFGLSLPRERFDALWEAAARMPSAELHVSGDVEVYRLQDGYDSVSYLATDKRNQLGPVSIKLVEGSFNDTPTTALTPARRGGDELAKGLRTITRLLWAILTLLLIVALKN
ncbi:hypothetical protein [Phenylobacterium sp.]|jgi:hypothetical protein|uniref:hypothetical protein n=1 Tax=Phenylobacterium sp. TaxID=1871053 RepID=UPI00378415F1